MEKSVRVRIGAQFPGMLPRDGMTAREYAGHAVYARLPSVTKLRMAERGKAVLAKLAATKRSKSTLS